MLLCLDPSFSNFGCSVVNEYGQVIDLGTIHTEKSKKKLLRVADDDVQRVTYIVSQLHTVIDGYKIKGILAELPPSSSQSASAAKGLASAMTIVVALATVLNIPVEWATPEEVKKAMCGKANASKEDMMAKACEIHGWQITEKPVYSKKTGKIQRINKTYHPLGRPMGKNKFEHIADSLGALEALRNTNTARMFLQRRLAA